jgi:DNA-binding NarL/FixJ family response regulator
MSPGQAIKYALSDEEERKPPTLIPQQHPPPDERTKSLTRREREVALFVARGHTNRRIASQHVAMRLNRVAQWMHVD